MKLPMVSFLKSKVFKRYLLSYFLIMIIPTTVLILLIHFVILPSLKREMVTTNRESLEMACESISKQFESLDRIALNIVRNPYLTTYMIRNATSTALEMLKSYRRSSPVLGDILYWVNGSDYVYRVNDSSISSYEASASGTVDEMFGRMFISGQYGREELADAIEASFGKEVFHLCKRVIGMDIQRTQNYVDCIALVYPILSNDNANVRLIFVLNQDTVMKLSRGMRSRYGESIAMFTHKGKLIFSTVGEDEALQGYLRRIEADFLDDEPRAPDGYIVSRTVSATKEYVYYAFIDESAYTGVISQIQYYMLTALAVIFLLGGAFIYLFSRRNYLPIKRLLDTSENMVKDRPREYRNEFERLEQAIHDLHDTGRMVQQSVSRYSPVLRDYVIRELKDGRSVVDDACMRKYLQIGHNYFSCVNVKFPIHSKPLDPTCGDLIPPEWEGRADIFAVDHLSPGNAILILNVDPQLKDHMDRVAGDIVSRMFADSQGVQYTAGNVYPDILSVGKSYLDIIQAEDYPYDMIRSLKEHLSSGNIELVRRLLSSIFYELGHHNLPRYMTRCIVQDILDIVLKCMVELGIELPDMPKIRKLALADETDIPAYDDEIVLTILDICECICENADRKNTILEAMKGYIQQNYENPNFSVDSMAEHLGFSPSYLSHYYKDRCAENITDFVWGLRLKKAKEYLLHTDMLVKEISLRVGYQDVNSFVRRFHASQGISPGAFRAAQKP